MTLDFTQIQDSRIAEYSFGRVINSVGVNVFSSTDARLDKKIFGNDPDPIKEVVLDNHTNVVQDWIAEHPGGLVDQKQEIILGLGDAMQVHHRSVMFGSSWKSDSIASPNVSMIYHSGSFTHFRFPGLARLRSLGEGGNCACSGFENRSTLHRKVHVVDTKLTFTPSNVGAILVPLRDAWYHNTKMRIHFPFLVSEPDTVTISMDEPGLVLEFTDEEPNVAEFLRSWLDQVERGLIEIVDRVYEL
jgi:hypothetical protein